MEQQELFDDSAVVVEEEKPKTLALDPQRFEIELNVSSGEKPKIVSAMLRCPLPEEDFKYADQISTEYRDAGSNEDEIVVDDEKAGSELFDKIIAQLKGFVLKGEPKERGDEFRDAQPLKHLIPAAWKAAFVRGMRLGSAKLIDDANDYIVLGGNDTLEVELIVGYEEKPVGTARFFVPEPTESERVSFNDASMKFLQGRGRKKSSRLVTNLKVCVEFFDKLMERPGADVQLGTVGGKTLDQSTSPLTRKIFLAGINPVYKAKIINAAMTKYNARLTD